MPTESQLAFLSGDIHKGIVGLVSGGAGLVSEIRQAKKEKCARSSSTGPQSAAREIDGNSEPVAELEGSTTGQGTRVHHAEKTANADFTAAGNIFSHDDVSKPHSPLPCPVIIPQRRPGKKRKGFAGAYAPI